MAPLICLPAITALVLIIRTTRTDLSDLVPVHKDFAGHVLLSWHELERYRSALRQGGISNGTPVRILGYMAEGAKSAQKGELVSYFVLLPNPGNALHPAHRFGDQMIGVRLPEGANARYLNAQLVWASGNVQILPGDPNGNNPLYLIVDAVVEPAAQADIAIHFR
jgi:hypothetical protein